MLIECIGLPGSGKTTLAAKLKSRFTASWPTPDRVRKATHRAARLMELCGISQPRNPQVRQLVVAAISEEKKRAASDFNLRWRAKVAQQCQSSRSIVTVDELLIHGLFTALGPTNEVAPEIADSVEQLILKTYRSQLVAFVHLRPLRGRWLQQVESRRRGRSRFGREASASVMIQLREDRLYSDVLLPILVRNGYAVNTVSECDDSTVDSLTVSLRRRFSSVR